MWGMNVYGESTDEEKEEEEDEDEDEEGKRY